MADVPVGLSEAQVIKALAGLQAFGEIMNVPGPQLQTILAKAAKEMRLKPATPVGPGPP